MICHLTISWIIDFIYVLVTIQNFTIIDRMIIFFEKKKLFLQTVKGDNVVKKLVIRI